MTKRFRYPTCLFVMILSVFSLSFQNGFTQIPGLVIKGRVFESGSGIPLRQVLVSVSSTGTSTQTDSVGAFTIDIPDSKAELILDLPGYNKRNIFVLGRDSIIVSLVASEYKSMDNYYNNPLGVASLKNATYAVSILNASDIDLSKSTSFDQNSQGRISGLRIIEHWADLAPEPG